MNHPSRAPTLENLLIRASAGTGKTFQLSNRFLTLVRQGVPCESVLATTFTRKAAGEILDRVIGRLAAAADDADSLRELAGFTGGHDWSRAACLTTLQTLMRSLHRLRVSTLDSLFAQIARTYGLELGFPFGWRIVEDLHDQQLRRRAIDAVLTEGDESKLRTLVHLLTKGEASRGISQLIHDSVKDMYDLFQETSAEAWRQTPRSKPLEATELRDLLDALQAADGLDKRMATARDDDVARAQQGAWAEFLSKGLAAKIAQDEPVYYKKPIPETLVALYRRLLEHVRAELVGRVAAQTEATYALLEMFHAEYQRLKTEHRALRFEDVTRRLAGVGHAVHLQGLSFRLDSRVDHLLLDEFQDTSPQQWRVIQPWAERVTGGSPGPASAHSPASAPGPAGSPGPAARRDTSFFCVGDVKQAIYGWRGGEAAIFDAIDRQLPGLTQREMNVSFRSALPVIDTVNRIFTRLGEPAKLAIDLGRAAAGVAQWTHNFGPHDTQRRQLGGYAELVAAPAADEGQSQWETTLGYAAQRIADLASRAPGHSIGVLMRQNKGVARVIHELGRLGVAASEEGGNPLSDSAAVSVVLSALRLADHPGDTIARFHLATSPLAATLTLTDHADDAAARCAAFGIRQDLARDGYGAVVQRWAHALASHCTRRDLSRLEQLIDSAYDYEPIATLRASDFVAYVQSTRVPDPIPADVRVMTIHQAKGLQFDAVFLPELEASLVGQHPAVVVERLDVTGPVTRVCRYAAAEIQRLMPATFREMFEAATARDVNEALCVLYVAVTRAIHALYMIIPPSTHSERKIPSTMAGLLRATLTDDQRAEPATVLYAHGDPAWFRTDAGGAPRAETGAKAEKARPDKPITVRLAPLTNGRQRGWERARPSGLEGGSTVSLEHLFSSSRSAAFARGQLVHAWFEQVHWVEDGPPDLDRLRAVARELLATELTVDRDPTDELAAGRDPAAGIDLTDELTRFQERLTSPPIADVLSRRRYADLNQVGFSPAAREQIGARPLRAVVQNERGFAIRDGAQLLTGFIDRLVLLEDQGRVVAAEVIDFKTDVFDADDSRQRAAKVAFYTPQVQAYRRAVSQLIHCPPERIAALLLFVEAGLVVPIK